MENPTTFALVRSPAPIITFPAPASSNAACGFPALRFPACFTSRVMRPIQPRLHVIFRLSSSRRLSHLASASHVDKVVTDSRAASLHRRYSASQVLPAPPPPSRLSADFPVLPVIRPTFAPPISQRGEEGFSSCLARPRHRTVATTPQEFQPVCARHAAFVQDLRTQPPGLLFFEATCAHSRYGPATRRPPPVACQWASAHRFPSSLPSTGYGSIPR